MVIKKRTIIQNLVLGAGFLFFTCCINNQLGTTTVSVESNFDRGSMGPVRIIGDSLVKGQTMHWIKRDMLGNQFYWFYFRISGVAGKEIAFELDNMQGTYRGKRHRVMDGILKPVVSYDQERWDRIMDTRFDQESNTFYFRHRFTENEAWIAYAHPYPLSRGESLIKELEKKGVDIDVIGHSKEGRDINLLTFPTGAEYSSEKKVILIIALQHSGEDCGGFFTEGMIQSLMEGDEHADQLLDRYIFKIAPMVNPDGLYHGVCRYNNNMEDLNSEWDDGISDTVNIPAEPEVMALRNWVSQWMEDGARIDFAVDIHSQTQWLGHSCLHLRFEEHQQLVENINGYWPTRAWPVSANPLSGGCLNYFVDHIGTEGVTVELSQSHNDDGKFLTIPDYQLHGKQFLSALDEYLQSKDR